MNIEEMQSTWATLSRQLEKQQKLTDTLIMQMAQERYEKKISVISFYESIGAIICFLAAVFIFINFNKLDDAIHMILGVFTLLVLTVLPVAVFWSIKKLKQINITNRSYTNTILEFNKRRRQFLLIQKVGVAFAFPIFFGSMPVFSKVMGNKSILENGGSLSLYLFIAFWVLVMIFFIRWGSNKYKNITSSARSIIEELEE
ncbi:hypothetical protein ABN763_03965 [Spongiivirga sp. MCCC 1A20706]|uniref:hypothetical protein n=1 Tax=Spongiivirga sp. MCCC 1A20706 TaxID=3160963 RepID=UPI0039777AE1